MGCGGSKLKGDDVPTLNSQAVNLNPNQPIKKVNTNFSAIDYDQDAQHRRLTEYAPHETPARPPSPLRHDMPVQATEQQQQQYQEQWQTSSSFATAGYSGPGGVLGGTSGTGYPHEQLGSQAGGGGQQRPGGTNDDGAQLKPYQTIDGGDWDRENEQQQRREDPHVRRGDADHDRDRDRDRDPTSSRAKEDFAEENDPANPRSHGHDHRNGVGDQDDRDHDHDRAAPTAAAADGGDDDGVDDVDEDGNKKSWLGQKYSAFQSAKQGKGVSDDDLKTYTGKDRAEFDDWAANHPGVGGRQVSGTTGSDAAYGAPYIPS